MKTTIGTDPEVFLDHNGSIISAIGLVGGTKEEPILVNDGAVQEDNVLAEFNTNPASSSQEFIKNINSVMYQLEQRVFPYKLKILSSHRFTQEALEAGGEKAMEFGCNPDLNAWTEMTNDSPNPYTTLRTAGGHVHVGFDVGAEDEKSRFDVIKLMDIYLGVPSVLLDPDMERRKLYGQAGACRLKPYGVEYRVLSNFWLQSDELKSWVYNQSIKAVQNKEYLDEILKKYSPKVIQTTINMSDVITAELIVNDLQLELV